MTLKESINNLEIQIIKDKQQLLRLERELNKNQQLTIKILQQICQQMQMTQKTQYTKRLSIGEVLERYRIKNGIDSEETRRKCKTIAYYSNKAGLELKCEYTKFHKDVILLKIFNEISDRKDIKGDQKAKHARWIVSFVKFAVFAYPDLYKTDVLVGLPSMKKTPKSAKCPHTPYTDEQLKSIFDPNKKFFYYNPEIFWGCMIALFTGARKNAAFTLQYKDIILKDGIWCINFIEDSPGIKQLKTEESERIVPIHSALLKMGFLEYINRKHKNNDQDFIFKKTCLTSKGNLNPHITRNFFIYLKDIGVKNPEYGRFDFHSFRKNANIMMEKCGILRPYIDKIIGWMSRGSEGERSYSNYSIKQVSEQLELLRYDCLKTEFKRWQKIMSKI